MNKGEEPAYPCGHLDEHGVVQNALNYGMTIREHFAGLAMQGICAAKPVDHTRTDGTAVFWESSMIAKLAWAIADAMLAEQEKQDRSA